MLRLLILGSLASVFVGEAVAEEPETAKSAEDIKQSESTDSAEKQVAKEDKSGSETVESVSLFEQQITQAKEHVQAKSFDLALDALSKAEKEMSKSERVLTTNEISQVWFYRGVVQSLLGEDPLESWRQALIINLGQEWDATLIPDDASRDVFLALKTEVQNRRIVSVQHPEQYGHAKLYVDGFLRAPGDFVYQGEHLAQIECPNGEVFGKWTNFEKTFKWIKMCPYKFDVTDMPEPESVDEWDMFGGGFGGGDSAPEVNMSNQMVADPLLTRMNKPTLYGSIGSAVLAGALYGIALRNASEFEDLDNALTVAELDSLRSKTNTIAVTSMTFGVLSGGLYMYSMSTAKISD